EQILVRPAPAGGRLRPGRQPAVETASPLTRLDLDCTRLALPIARAARRPLLPRPTGIQVTGAPKLRSQTTSAVRLEHHCLLTNSFFHSSAVMGSSEIA